MRSDNIGCSQLSFRLLLKSVLSLILAFLFKFQSKKKLLLDRPPHESLLKVDLWLSWHTLEAEI